MKLNRSLWLTLFLFLAALLPRLPGLALFLTSDENTNIFFAGSDVIVAFLRGDWRGTYWHFYPGVTMSWLDAAGMAGQYLLARLAGTSLPPFTDYVYSDILELIVANRLPYALLTAAAVPAIYWLARRLLPAKIALLGALLLAFDPFFLAHSRVAHGDAPVAVFMILATLTFFRFVERARNGTGLFRGPEQGGGQSQGGVTADQASLRRLVADPYLVASAVFGGLAALTKTPGPFMALFVVGLAALYTSRDLYRAKVNPAQIPSSLQAPRFTLPLPSLHQLYRTAAPWLAVMAVWGLLSLFTFGLLWPAMWVDPVGTLQRMWTETFSKVEEGHLVFFMGRPTLDPGPWFYPYVIPFRLTPVTLTGSGLALLLLAAGLASKWTGPLARLRRPLLLLWLFSLSLLLFGNLSPKKQDRYLLPLFPWLDLLAAVGWLGCYDLARYFIYQRFRPLTMAKDRALILDSLLPAIVGLVLVMSQLLPVLTFYPYYLTYFNPLLGGPVRAARTTLMGWGEGMEQVAAYLNSRPQAGRLYVASTPSQTLLPYFAGTGENFYTNDIAFRADYVVLYLAQMQRLAPSPEIVRYFEARQPEKVITIKDVVYARIYPGPRLIMADIPPEASPVNVGLADKLRLAGYRLAESGAGGLEVTLYWHALAPLAADYTVSVRAIAGTDQVVAQQDSWPVDGLLPTSLWRQGDYVADTNRLDVEAAQADQVEVVVYQADTGETLGPPIRLPLRPEP